MKLKCTIMGLLLCASVSIAEPWQTNAYNSAFWAYHDNVNPSITNSIDDTSAYFQLYDESKGAGPYVRWVSKSCTVKQLNNASAAADTRMIKLTTLSDADKATEEPDIKALIDAKVITRQKFIKSYTNANKTEISPTQ